MNLATAEHYARKIVEWLQPFTTRIEIAGSIRRGGAVCNDVDIVCVPKLEAEADLGGETGRARNLVREELIRYVKATAAAEWRGRNGEPGLEPRWDASNLLVKLPKCELDLWCANDVNFATRWMCRTGSKEHNIWMAQRARGFGLHWDPYRGLKNARGLFLVTTSEASLYEAVKCAFIPPEKARE